MDSAGAQELKKQQPDNPLTEIEPVKAPRLYTLGEYLRREERSIGRHEYFNGIVKRAPMAKGPHNIIAANVIATLKMALKAVEKQCIVFASNQKVYLPDLNFGLYPDALVVSEKPEYWDEEKLLLVNPVLIVEVLSKSTRNYDYNNKFSYYKTLPTFKEYILIEQTECKVETWYREESDLWRNTTVDAPDGKLSLRSLGCEILMTDIYEHVTFDTAGKAKSRPRKK